MVKNGFDIDVLDKQILSILSKNSTMGYTKIAEELKQARQLKQEAEAVLKQYQQKLDSSSAEAEKIIIDARTQAESMVKRAEENLTKSMERRMQQAFDRIEQQEIEAMKDVRDHIVDLTVVAARELIIEQFSGTSNEDMLRSVMQDLDRKLH